MKGTALVEKSAGSALSEAWEHRGLTCFGHFTSCPGSSKIDLYSMGLRFTHQKPSKYTLVFLVEASR
jgi:hypothetical protein